MKKLRTLALLLIDLAIVAMEIMALRREFAASGLRILRYYTQDSNLLALAVCAICAAVEILCLFASRPLPGWTRILRHVAACCLMVTIIVSMAILVPSGTSGSFRSFMLKGTLLYLHTLCPLAMLLGWFVHTGPLLGAKHALVAILPTILYGAVTLVMNAMRIYRGPYFFFEVHRQPVSMTVLWCIVIIGGNYALAWLLGKVHAGKR